MTEQTQYVNIDAAAEYFGKTVRTIHRWRLQGMPCQPNGTIDLAAADSWRRVKKGITPAMPTELAQQSATPDGAEQTQVVNATGKDWWDKENKKFQARMRELDYRKRRGELIEKKKVEDEFVSRVHAVKQALLALERSLPPDLVACRSEREMSAVIHKVIRGILETFSRPLPVHLLATPDGVAEDDQS
jgi:hypothetical protein